MKKSILPLLAASLVITSCSSAYKAGQTPDDVYYSHGPTAAAAKEEVAKEENDVYSSYWQDADDSYLRMKVQDRDKWSTIDDVNYWYGYNSPYSAVNTNWYGYSGWNVSLGWNTWNRWSNPFYFNSYYNNWNNPYCWNQPVVVINKFPTRVAPRPTMNTQGYRNYGFDRGGNTIFSSPKGINSANRPSNNDLFRSIFRTSESSNSGSSGSSWDRPTRSLNSGSSGNVSPSSSSGSSSSGSSSGSNRSSGSSGSGRRGN